MPAHQVNAAMLVGSTREARFGNTVADWFATRAAEHGDVQLDVIDLAEIPLPVVHQAQPVVSGEYAAPEVRAFARRIDAADGFVIVTPEYNHGYPASLKLAIDSVNPEWHAKPVGFVSYGGISGGLRCVEQLRQVFVELHAVPIRDGISFHWAHGQFDQDGQPHDPEGPNVAAKTMLDQLVWWSLALREARAKRPYGF